MKTRKHDSIMFVVDNISKSSHLILVKSTHRTSDIRKIFMKKIFLLHGLPKAIVYVQDAKFISNFWKGLFQDLGTQLNFRMTYHSQIDN